MKIRSITCFLDPGWPLQEAPLRRAGEFIRAARPAFEAAGYPVQSLRLATRPFPELVPGLDPREIVALAQSLETSARAEGFDYVALGPADPVRIESFAAIPDAIAATETVFLSGRMTLPEGGVSLPAVRACAEVIRRTARLTPDGFANLRFGALANLPPNGPFLPGAFLGGEGSAPRFALAIEAADLAVEVCGGAESLQAARRDLIAVVEGHARRLTRVAETLQEPSGLSFEGIDFTLAPFPSETASFGGAMERLGLPAVGLHGSLAAAAFLTDTLDRAEFRRAGFNGLMLPLLEDSVLAARAAQGTLGLMDLLMYSAVCGTGLDTIPLPGDISAEEIYAVLLDLAALAQRLDKPLIARLMPVPGKAAGEPTAFDFAFFANSRVQAVRAQPLTGLLAGSETFFLRPRRRP